MSDSDHDPGFCADRPPRIRYDAERNTLRLIVGGDAIQRVATVAGILDVGVGGRLLGLELDISGSALRPPATIGGEVVYEPALGTLYVAVAPAAEEGGAANARSAEIAARVLVDADGRVVGIEVPRRGAGYEITYPSGNQ